MFILLRRTQPETQLHKTAVEGLQQPFYDYMPDMWT
jgi:hypothetical protein